MKINPVAIQSYQQTTGSNKMARPAVKSETVQVEEKLSIIPQGESESSKLAIRPSGENYAKFLSKEERQALDLIFSKYNDSTRFGSGYLEDMPDTEESSKLGRMIDVKA